MPDAILVLPAGAINTPVNGKALAIRFHGRMAVQVNIGVQHIANT